MTKWNYVNTKKNPADIITRAASMNVINDVTWLEPPFVREATNVETTLDGEKMTLKTRNSDADTFEIFDVDEERFRAEAKEISHVTSIATDAESRVDNRVGNIINLEAYSSSYKLFRITAYVKRFITNTKYHVSMRKNANNSDTILNKKPLTIMSLITMKTILIT